jgi:hypothetical protein
VWRLHVDHHHAAEPVHQQQIRHVVADPVTVQTGKSKRLRGYGNH